jgi:hypothetical protein
MDIKQLMSNVQAMRDKPSNGPAKTNGSGTGET